MKTQLITPFVDATLNVVKTMASTEAVPGKPVKREDSRTQGEISGLIGMAGEQLSGNMILSFEKSTILAIVNRMLMESYTEIDDEIVDAVGELTNMITGGAKRSLSESGYQFSMATPIMVVGKGTELKQLSSCSPIVSIPFETPDGHFWVDANLAPVGSES